MTTLQNSIVFLWLAPVFVLVVVPVLWSLFRVLYSAVERSRLADVRGYIEAGTSGSEKRHIDRVCLEEARAYVNGGCSCCKAAVTNISKDGICLRNINPAVSPEADDLKVVFRTRRKDYALTARPIWKNLTDRGYDIGAEIKAIPPGWYNLVEGFTRPSPATSAGP